MEHKFITWGYLGKTPESRYTPAGKQVTNFSFAESRSWTNSEGIKVEKTIWFNCSAWEKLGESLAKWFKKGSGIILELRLEGDTKTGRPRIWKNEAGESCTGFDATVLGWAFPPKYTRPDGVESNGTEMHDPAGQGSNMTDPIDDNNIPF